MPLLMRISAMLNNRTKLEELGASYGAFSANSKPFSQCLQMQSTMKGQDLLCSKVTSEPGAQESDSQSVDTLRQWVFWHVRSDSGVSHFVRSGFSITKEIKEKIKREQTDGGTETVIDQMVVHAIRCSYARHETMWTVRLM
jgi:hypothetical protein